MSKNEFGCCEIRLKFLARIIRGCKVEQCDFINDTARVVRDVACVPLGVMMVFFENWVKKTFGLSPMMIFGCIL